MLLDLCEVVLTGVNYLYCRGDTPFCSEECRQDQIERDDAKEKNKNISSMKALRKKEQRKSVSPNKDYSFRAGTVAAA